MDIPVFTYKTGDTIGLFRYLKLPVLPSVVTIRAITPVEAVRIPQKPMEQAEDLGAEGEPWEKELQTYWFESLRELGGGAILDEYGFDTGFGSILATRCIEDSVLFGCCDPKFVAQIP